ncbi:MAG TPA: PLP-dependent aminotransferase family protein [Rhodocyclaceae bacterium]|nr:PLP-dependent aminotransferase family protein [Rhodocyclaceae bacterium]
MAAPLADALDDNRRPGRFAGRLARLEPSPIREILSVIDRPGMISFAGGLPAPETFPELDLAPMPAKWLQYGPTEGDEELRRRLAEDLAAIGLACGPAQVLILSGSQQGIDLVAKLFIDPGTAVAVETPTYLAALQAFRLFGAAFLPLRRHQPAAALGAAPRPAFAYAIPTFQNPTGHCYDAAERAALAAACDASGVPLFEDDPYRDLVYDDCVRTPVCAGLRRASWIYQGSFSKTLAPGLRLGFLAASPDLVPHLVRLKQAADLHSSRISQWYVLERLQDPGRRRRLAEVAAFYRRKRDVFAAALERHFADLAQWQQPPGGLFFWLTLRQGIDTRRLLPAAIERGVAFMPGEPFFPDRPQACGALRLNFSHAGDEQIERGLAVLADLARESLASPPPAIRSGAAAAGDAAAGCATSASPRPGPRHPAG